jgi:mannonate dehydratase
MYLGTQVKMRHDDDYRVHAQLGVEHICGWPDKPHTEWDAAYLSSFREKVESFGLTLDIIPLPLDSVVAGSYTPGGGRVVHEGQYGALPNIMLGKSPERDREIEHVCDIIRWCAEAGIPAAKYNLAVLPVLRTSPAPGRGGSSRPAFRWSEVDPDEPPTIAGEVPADAFWERIDYVLERVVPVAEECKIRIACHPHDPPTPPGYRGVDRVLGTVEGYKKFVMMHESPYHGLNFCQGTVCEMLDNPAEEIFDVIRWFGERKKIFNVHFRNLIGKRYDFVETFQDEGEIDMLRAARVYEEVGYPYMLMPDHVAWVSGENNRGVSFAFSYGYIQGIIQAATSG